jgi:hypothetical protein
MRLKGRFLFLSITDENGQLKMAADEKSTLRLFCGISCVTILKYTLILSPQFTKSTENKTSKQKEN